MRNGIATAIAEAPNARPAHRSCFCQSPSCAPGTVVALYTMRSPIATSPSAALAIGMSIAGIRMRSLIATRHLHAVGGHARQRDLARRDPRARRRAVVRQPGAQHLTRERRGDAAAMTGI